MTRTPLPQVGDRFGRWTVVGGVCVIPDKARNRAFMCRCDCGREYLIRLSNLGKKSVMCAECRLETTRDDSNTKTPAWSCWRMMISRCYDSRLESYRWYGERGIRVCVEWIANFQAFLAHIGPRPSSKYTIDRIDSDGHYEPGNVRWATHAEQMRNKRQRQPERWDLTCACCGNAFSRLAKRERQRQKRGDAGPFCSSRCRASGTLSIVLAEKDRRRTQLAEAAERCSL